MNIASHKMSPYDPEIETLWRAIGATGVRGIALVSGLGNEGTGMVARALARRAALSGTPALLVNLDGTHRIRPTPPGEIVPLPDAQVWAMDNVAPEDAAAWREPKVLAARIEEWSAKWGLIVFETTPVLHRDQTCFPATSVAAVADATVLVTLAGRTTATAIRETRARLDAAAARLIGVVMNDLENPPLLAELEREIQRFARWLPRVAAAIRKRLRNTALLTVRI